MRDREPRYRATRQRAPLRVEIVPKRNEIDLHFQRTLIVPSTGISFVNFEVITRPLLAVPTKSSRAISRLNSNSDCIRTRLRTRV